MESVITALRPYKHEIGTTAIYLAIAANLSGLAVCSNIRRKGTTKDISPVIFVTNIMMGLIKYRTGILLDDDTIKGINTAVIVLNSVFCAYYYLYATDKWNEIIKQFSVCIAVSAVMWRYTEWEDPSVVKYRYGLTGTILTLSLLSRPIIATRDIIKKKNASQIPLFWTIISTLFTLSTVLYSSITNLTFMLIQSSVAFALSLTRLLLIFVYPGKPPQADKKKKQ